VNDLLAGDGSTSAPVCEPAVGPSRFGAGLKAELSGNISTCRGRSAGSLADRSASEPCAKRATINRAESHARGASSNSSNLQIIRKYKVSGLLGLRRQVALAVMLTGIFVTIMDSSIVNVAIPSIRSTLGASFAEAELVIAGYAFTFAVGLITGGRLGDIFGQRRMFLVGFGAFTLTSTLCGLAPWPTVLLVARLLQGMSAAILSPQVFALVRVTFAEGRERSMAFAVMGVVIGLANVIGQILGGLLVQADLFGLSWRAVFLVNIPIGIISLVVAPFVLEETKRIAEQRLDLPNVALSTTGLSLVMLPLIEGPELRWPTWSIAMLVASPAMMAAFYLHQRWKSVRRMRPLLDTHLFHDRAFSVGLLLVLVFWATNTPFAFSFTLVA
jgi:MFS family permease